MPQRVHIAVTRLRQTQFCKPLFEIRLVLNLPKIIFRSEAIQISLLGLPLRLLLENKRKLENLEEQRCFQT